MRYHPYLAERLAEGRMRDAMREVEQAQLIRAAKGPGEALDWRLRVASVLIRLGTALTDGRGDDSCRRSPSTASSPALNRCSGG